MAVQPPENPSQRLSVARLWAGWALPAGGWGFHLLSSHALVEWYCNSGAELSPDGVQWLLRGITALALLLALAGTLLARQTMTRTGDTATSRAEGQALRRFMGVCGLFLGVLFLAIILVQGLPSLVLEPCQ